MMFVDKASSFHAKILVTNTSRGDEALDGKSAMELMLLDAPKGSRIRVQVSFVAGKVTRDGGEFALGYYEGEVLRQLLRAPGQVVDRKQMLKEIWGVENEPMNRSVDNHIVSLRRKLESDPSKPRHILTVHGLGYKLVT